MSSTEFQAEAAGTQEPAAVVTPGPPQRDPAARYVDLEYKKRELKAQIDEIDDEMAALESVLLEQWADNGTQNQRLNGMTLFLATEFFCNKKAEASTSAVCDALRAAGLDQLVSEGYNAASLKSWVRERRANNEDLPTELADLLNQVEVVRLRVRKS